MQNGLMPSARTAPGFFLDPRTKILLVMVCPTILIAGSEEGVRNWIRLGLALLPLFLFLMSGRFKTTIKLGLIYAAAYLLKLYLVPLTGGLTGFLMVALTGIFTRFIPGLAIGYYLVSTTTVSEFIASMERMHVP